MKKVVLMLFLISVILIGCATTQKPLFGVDEEGNPIMIKRYPKRMDIGFFHRWSRTAYHSNKSEVKVKPKYTEMMNVLEESGQPDYMRKPIKSIWGDTFEEWVYWDLATVFQFVQGQIVYIGPLTDLEKTLIIYGYPNFVERNIHDDGSMSLSVYLCEVADIPEKGYVS